MKKDEQKTFTDTQDIPTQPEQTDTVWGRQLIKRLLALSIGAGDKVAKIDVSGIWLGNKLFVDAPFSVDMDGNVKAQAINITGGTITGTTVAGYLTDVIVDILAADPTGIEGLMYFNSVDEKLRIYYDGTWRDVCETTALLYDAILLETGDSIMLETGDYLLLE